MASSRSSEEVGFKEHDLDTAGGDTGLRILQRGFRAARIGSLSSITSQQGQHQSKAFPLRSIIRRFTAGSLDAEAGHSFPGEDDKARDEFFRRIFNHQSEDLKCYAERQWYTNFLEAKFRQVWPTLLEPVLVGIYTIGPPARPREIAIIYQFLTIVASALMERTRLALSDIIDTLLFSNPSLIKEPNDGNLGLPNQLAFTAVSWLTLLFEAVARPAPDGLEIRRHTTSLLHESLRTRAITRYRQGFETVDQPLYVCFKKFGSLIPELKAEPLGEAEVITAAYIYFAVLDKVAGVQIEWVNSLCLHLEFDHVRRILKVFRFPSFCKLMYQETNPLSRLYVDHARYFIRDRELEQPEEDRTQEYFREVLLTYRLLFGQDKASWKAFSKRAAKWPAHWDCSDKGAEDRDPLLPALCGAAWTSHDASLLYAAIGAQDDSPYYYSDSDFRFFGRRILDLQAFVKGRNPHSVRALWHDRRNIAFWWTFWAVLFIGGGTLFLGMLQLAFQIWQAESGQARV